MKSANIPERKEPLTFRLRESIPDNPGGTYRLRSTGSAGREDDWDDP